MGVWGVVSRVQVLGMGVSQKYGSLQRCSRGLYRSHMEGYIGEYGDDIYVYTHT